MGLTVRARAAPASPMAAKAAVLEEIGESLKPHGLALRGAFHPVAGDGAPELEGGPCGTILLLGNLGGSIWPAFDASPERADGVAHGLDRWTRLGGRMIEVREFTECRDAAI